MKHLLRTSVQVLSCVSLLLIVGGWQKEKQPSVKLSAGRPGSSLIDAGTLSVAFPILNTGATDAGDVQATAISLQGGSLTAPGSLPFAVGGIRAGSDGLIDATFKGSFSAGKSYLMKVEGTFKQGGVAQKFAVQRQVRIPPASPGSADTAESSAPAVKPSGTYPVQTPNDKDANPEYGWRVPNGPIRQAAPPPAETTLQPAPKEDPPPINFFTNVNVGVQVKGTTDEPSGAVGGKVIFVTYNSKASFSTDGGSNFTILDPTTIFPDADGHFCCDQVVQYAASIDRILWILLYRKGSNGENRIRIAAASPKDIQDAGKEDSKHNPWIFWDITSAGIKQKGKWLDYPDTSIGDNSLYISSDVVGAGGYVVVRVPLSEIKSGSTIHYRYTNESDSPMAWGSHLAQNAADEIFWAGPKDNSTLRVFSWKENSNTYHWRDVDIASWPNSTLSSLTPDHQDWLTKAHGSAGTIKGATRLTAGKGSKDPSDQLWFGWTASKGSGFKQPHIEWVSLAPGNQFSVIHQSEVWNDTQAYAYPAFSSNSDGELGMSLETGGGGKYENHACGFWGDFVVYITTSTDVGTTRFGDYVTIRQDAAHPARFDAFGYGLHKTGAPIETRYMQFGRP